ncbi:MAG: polyphenol oxidase family protein [Myxococcales bacterium]
MTEKLFVTSRLLAAEGVVHGFSVRRGGVSTGGLESLNLGRGVGDDATAVEENLQRLARAAGLPGPAAFASAYQVHGDRVVGASRDGRKQEAAGSFEFREIFPATEAPPSEPAAGGINADAVVALEPGIAAAVRVADCVPVLLFAPERGVGVAVHSGWKGTRLSIAARGVRALQHVTGADPKNVLAAIGPSIGRCCYEVSPDLADLFRSLFGPDAADDPAKVDRPHLDLRRCVEGALLSAGVPAERIEQVAGCTSCDRSSFFSHRRDQGRTGRHMAFIASRT